ncbi:excinuclease ABC subunit A [Candidatus Fermentibacteria bacterium]|nr:MAG: excinuclease ABC subunit A [Candidatus Fermentibacteria bacterium]
MSSEKITVRGAREHNLKGVSLEMPRQALVVCAGVSGSGKSSFAFDTLYAEGQRRYIESLSSYARQFLGQMEKPDFDSIDGLSPAISIEQKTVSHNPRSTVGTVTEIADYLRVLWARAGVPHCPSCGRTVTTQTTQQMTDTVMGMPESTRLYITAPVISNRKGSHEERLEEIREKGFVRIILNGEMMELDALKGLNPKKKNSLSVVVDRLVQGPEIESRLNDSIETAVKLGNGIICVVDADTGKELLMSEHNACVHCGISLPELSPQLFSFNNPVGMCPECSGLGYTLKVDPELLVPKPAMSIKAGAVVPWGIPQGWVAASLRTMSEEMGFKLSTPWKLLSEEVRNTILYGSGEKEYRINWKSSHSSGAWNGPFEGVVNRINRLYHQTGSDDMRKYYEKFFRKYVCEKCQGSRIREEARAVTLGGKGIQDISSMPVGEIFRFFQEIELNSYQKSIAERLLKEIRARLGFLQNVGLHYLTLDRAAPSLSGGEAQRIRLASQIGSGLTGVLYVLDEPTVGLHPRDNARLLETLEHLRDIGNTVVVVEHDTDTLLKADHIVDFGPGAGVHGGKVVAQGSPEEIMEHSESITGAYLSGRMTIERLGKHRTGKTPFIKLKGASLHNLKSVDADIPLGRLVSVTGVSGSGKSSLISQTLYPAVSRLTGGSSRMRPGPYSKIEGLQYVDKIISISQDPIGRTPRSNPATYTKVFDSIRNLFAELPESRIRGYKPGRFSFNVKGGRCEDCHGAGVKRIEMHFLPDVFIECETCGGQRFNRETLKVRFREHSIADILELTIEKAMELFERVPSIYSTLKVIDEVGLGYIQLGQPAPTLSGGEAQRVKLARELSRPSTSHTLYILDEPTTGLHPHDVNKLLQVLDRLVSAGNTVVVIEHNLDVIVNSDWVIDLGPDGGDGGGEILAAGTPEQIAANGRSYTGMHLRMKGF